MHWSESNNVQTTFIEMHHHQEISPQNNLWKGSDYCVFLTNSIHVCPFVWQRQKMMEQFDKTPTIESTNHTQNFRTVRRWGCLKRISSLKKSPRTFFVNYISYFFCQNGQQECYNGSTCPKKLTSIPFVYLSANMDIFGVTQPPNIGAYLLHHLT